MANLKNITDLPVAESAEGLNLIVNDNGAAKQIAASEVGVKSWNDLKDKPFYTETEVILERQTLGFDEDADTGMYGCFLSETLTIPAGEVTVIWDGVEYKCNNTGNMFGNTALTGGEDTGEPFAFWKFDSFWGAIALVSTATSHEIGIIGETVHKLDAKYLPSGCGYDIKVRAWFEPVGDDFERLATVEGDFETAKQKILNDMPCYALLIEDLLAVTGNAYKRVSVIPMDYSQIDDCLDCKGKYIGVVINNDGSASLYTPDN